MDTSNQAELFLSVIEQNKGIIYKIANSFKKDEDDKKDLVQEIIFQLTYKNIHRKWVRAFIESFGGKKLSKAMEFLSQIEDYKTMGSNVADLGQTVLSAVTRAFTV